MQLELDEIEPGHRLRHRVPDPRQAVTCQERDAARCRLVQELDRAGAAVPGTLHQPLRRHPSVALLIGSEAGLEDSSSILCSPALHEQSHTPSGHTVPSPSAMIGTST